uniref:Transmembrane protein n=1 Tax=Clytia hemisphaerica TaxID=252671 RepID=A0A7M5X9Z1_9CNID|eukprot:TCONS_00071544-protein
MSLLQRLVSKASCTQLTHLCRISTNTQTPLLHSRLPQISQRNVSKILFSTSCSKHCSSGTLPVKDEDFRLIYEGPLSKRIKFLKLFSFTTATVSLSAPAVIFMSASTLATIAKAILASTVVVMGVTTTSLLHWLTRVYVYRMFFHPETRTFAAETSTIFGTTKRHRFSVEDITIPEIEHAFSTFEAKGNRYFLHVELKEADQILKYVREYNLETL